MEENNENISQTPTAHQTGEQQEPKPKNTSKVITIICAVLAIAGISFGVYGVTRKPEEKSTESTVNTELETELSEIKQKYSVLQNYVKELEASGIEIPEEAKNNTSFAIFSKSLAGTERNFLSFEPNRSLFSTNGSSDQSYYLFGGFSISKDNDLKINFGKDKQMPTLVQDKVATNVLLAFYVEHGAYDSGNKTFGGSEVNQYIYFIDLSGDVYRFRLTEDEPISIEHLDEYKEIIFIENAPGRAILFDIYGQTFNVDNL